MLEAREILEIHKILEKLGVHIPEILLPSKDTDLTRWSVIACDQYTSQPDYWNRVNEEVGSSPSTLRLTFPEIYLKDKDRESRIRQINESMAQYISQGILEPQKPGFILVDRSTPHTASRKGLILAVDLECYDYREGAQTFIRATEGTVLDRIPPRVKIRENAPIELPHIMLLIDDPCKTVIEKLFVRLDSFEKLYDFDLMQGGGHIRGWKVEDAESLSLVSGALQRLADPSTFSQKYGLPISKHPVEIQTEEPSLCLHKLNYPCMNCMPLLFAVGDGNHSLATAKAHWENIKAGLKQQGLEPQAFAGHPARYALVEVVNVHDDGLVFEPIHRVLFGIDTAKALDSIKNMCGGSQGKQNGTEYRLFDSKAAMEAAMEATMEATMEAAMKGDIEADTKAAMKGDMKTTMEAASVAGIEARINSTRCNKKPHILPFIMEGTYGLITVHNPSYSLEAGTVQNLIDELIRDNSGAEVDYIHGEQVVTELGSQKGCIGFYLPAMDKHSLFRTVILDGVLPKKTFSMGEAEEKRYYLECRRIR